MCNSNNGVSLFPRRTGQNWRHSEQYFGLSLFDQRTWTGSASVYACRMDDFFALEGVSSNRGQHKTSLKFQYLQSSKLSMVVRFKPPLGKKQVGSSLTHLSFSFSNLCFFQFRLVSVGACSFPQHAAWGASLNSGSANSLLIAIGCKF